MILKKIIIDGKVVYEPISYEEALAYPNKEELIFTSDDEKEEFEEKLEELEELAEKIEELDEKVEELIDNLDEVDSSSKQTILSRLEEIKVELESYKDLSDEDLDEKLDSLEEELDEMDDTIDELIDELDDENDDQEDEDDEPVKITINGKKINLGKDFGATFGKAFGNMFCGKKISDGDDLIAALPFMDKNDLLELVNDILNGDEQYKDINLVTVIPFLDTSDCDALFMKFVKEENKYNTPLVTVAPFVSKKCLSELVDEYVNGNYQHVEMSTLYPFLDGKDVKKVFNYILAKKNK